MSAYEKMLEEEKKKVDQDPDYKPTIDYSVYVRASIDLVTAASLNAILNGHSYVSMSDVNDMAVPVLAHRIAMAYGAEMTSEAFVKQTVFTASKTAK
jgi:MoxR-like ATPase